MQVTIRPKQAYDMLQDAGVVLGIEKLKQGIRQGVWPWADYIAAESERQDETYIIYAIPFRRWLRARSPYVKPDALDALEVEPLTNDKEAHQ